MRFIVSGADSDTGEDVELTVEAHNAAAAQEKANQKGIMVAHVTPQLANVAPPKAIPMARSTEEGHVRSAPVVNVAMPRRGSSLGIASLVLGSLAFLICWIPVVNLLGAPLAAVGLLLGLAGVVVAIGRRGAGIGFPIAGIAICGVSLAVTIMTIGALATIGEAARLAATGSATPGPAVPDAAWLPAGSPIRHEDIELRIVAVRLGPASIQTVGRDAPWETDEPMLQIVVELLNTSEARKITYSSWRAWDSLRLVDNFGNRYSAATLALTSRPVGSVIQESVYPGKSVRDVLVFEAPVDKAEHLDIELPASAFDGRGTIRVRIPASMIER